MTNTKSHPIKVATKTAKKVDPFASLKSGIMMVSIAGTMAGWLLLLNQETDSSPANTAILSTAISENGEMAIVPTPTTPIVDINQLRQVNEVASAPVEAIRVVARTRSSQ